MAGHGSGDGTVGKALEVLDMVAHFERPIRFSELLNASPYPKATLYRLIQTLTSQRMLSFDPEAQTYALGVRLLGLAHAAWSQSSLAPLARPFIDALSRSVGETVHLAQLDHAQVLYVDKRNARDPIQMYSMAGKVGPAYCTGVGKAMLAFLPEKDLAALLLQQSYHRFTPKTRCDDAALREDLVVIRQRGYAFDDEEHEPNIICVALPILTEGGRVLGGLSITSSTHRSSLSELEKLVPKMQETTKQIQEVMRNWHFPDQKTQTQKTGYSKCQA
ncbi:IclR family transcriptional regulator [Falsihalocynthiibacter arcticus]|uniref:IclR family transcriptional regulator n=1 Tax=Falsihalocynthiibacter arcticus TaxID=1579316 RepID=A0A126UWI0_9RHOB|nr:IclR family transcriptional regulator [Falsihalocynthiibacter arcticus]AML50384.1 IclR family transcriptional regulator [Falsihalocynthiibacter arcticus]